MARKTGLNDILNPLLFPQRRLRVSTFDVPAVDYDDVILAAIELDDEIDFQPRLTLYAKTAKSIQVA